MRNTLEQDNAIIAAAGQHKTLIAECGDAKLYRIDPVGCFEGDFYFEYVGVESCFIDGCYVRADEAKLVENFKADYA